MLQTWRWFGPNDLTKLEHVRQAGATGVVSALHHVRSGDVWTPAEIDRRKRDIERFSDERPSGLHWAVVESLVVSEDIKQQRGDFRAHYANYRQSLENLKRAGIETICYNFMPVIDWTRTNLRWPLPNGGTAMRFDYAEFAAFDIHLLKRPGARDDFPEEIAAKAGAIVAGMDDAGKKSLVDNVVAGLPGANEHLTLDNVRELLSAYDEIDADRLRRHLTDFLSEVVPTAERLGMRLCCHPDDPPFPLLGLPRVMSTMEDYRLALGAVPSPANGMTFCTGSLGARPDNDLVEIVRTFAPDIHFVHLRNVTRQSTDIAGSFFEDEHLGGQADMVAIIAELMIEEKRRRAEGRTDHQIPMRPDHGQDIADDLGRRGQPGYPTIGRLKGLAELRGVMTALAATHPDLV
ncbi:MAG: mannonate dehydratase [Hyphomicrobiaceae bacterium]|nr:mannonate dehydratase [Hyphomicrobiaceae bacterium]